MRPLYLYAVKGALMVPRLIDIASCNGTHQFAVCVDILHCVILGQYATSTSTTTQDNYILGMYTEMIRRDNISTPCITNEDFERLLQV